MIVEIGPAIVSADRYSATFITFRPDLDFFTRKIKCEEIDEQTHRKTAESYGNLTQDLRSSI